LSDAPLDEEICERARLAQDSRFDGRFFIAVRSTGVYCRPICPVRPPKRENVSFFPSAAAAHEAGFRPCLRCRPESSPGTPASAGTAATVVRALRLIEQGALSEGSVETLAARLGIGSRHLGRLFSKHLGASPVKIAQTHRLHLAVKLLHETGLPIAHIAAASGFGSVRRMNEVVKRCYARPPSALRREGHDEACSGGVQLELAYRPPLDWMYLREFLALRALPGVESVGGDVYRRSIEIRDQRGWIAVEPVAGRDRLRLTVELPKVTSLAAIVGRVRAMFDLDAEPTAIARDLSRDPALAEEVARRPGLRVPGAWDPFELAVRAVLGQGVSVAAARTLAGRVVARFGEDAPQPARAAGLARLFPRADPLVAADLAPLGVTAGRAAAIRALARAHRDGRLDLSGAQDLERFAASLETVPGVGPWTAQYIAMRSGGHPDAFPASDLGLRRGAAACLGARSGDLDARALEARAAAWRPWRAYAAMYLWQVYARLPRTRRTPREATALAADEDGHAAPLTSDAPLRRTTGDGPESAASAAALSRGATGRRARGTRRRA
jgi:AraC family transcriptional regulator of adaptative response / DNA-3-methyladenine glycosylase II